MNHKKETNIEFNNYWDKTYGNLLPIDFQFKFGLFENWFRIHNLPNSKRYPEDESEMEFIIKRQNNLLNDLIEKNDDIFYLIGNYNHKPEKVKKLQTEIGEFLKAGTIDLFKTKKKIQFGPYDKGDLYEIYIKKCKWNFKAIESVLMKIINDSFEYRFSIINSSRKRIFIPYHGGMDIILETKEIKDKYREKYKQWLSKREDGL